MNLDIPINIENDYKDALLANLNAIVDILRKEIEEKNYFIRALLDREKKIVIHPLLKTPTEGERHILTKERDVSLRLVLTCVVEVIEVKKVIEIVEVVEVKRS